MLESLQIGCSKTYSPDCLVITSDLFRLTGQLRAKTPEQLVSLILGGKWEPSGSIDFEDALRAAPAPYQAAVQLHERGSITVWLRQRGGANILKQYDANLQAHPFAQRSPVRRLELLLLATAREGILVQ
jgi:hypothetical protein